MKNKKKFKEISNELQNRTNIDCKDRWVNLLKKYDNKIFDEYL